jgi:hypothetical protein
MARFQVILSRRAAASESGAAPSRGKLWRLKSLVAAFLIISAAIGLLLAALVLGSFIAALCLILVVAVLVVAIGKAIFHRVRMRR